MRAGGAAAPEHDGEDVRDLKQQARERPVRVLRKRPEQPAAAEVQEHEISGHEPYRSWRLACVAGRGRADAHVRRVFPSLELTTATCGAEHQKRQMRHMMRLQARIRQMESEPRRQCLVEGAVWIGGKGSSLSGKRGQRAESCRVGKELQAGGYHRVVVRSDGEPALLAHVKAARAMTLVSDVPLEMVHEQVSKEQSPGSGLAEGAVKELKAKIRTLRHAQRRVLGGESWRLMTASRGWYRMRRPRSIGFGQGSTGRRRISYAWGASFGDQWLHGDRRSCG